ncbi:hypothetical protein XEUV354_23725, partial [Xanthomonas euvesicatoria]|uniref:HAD family hydrolase n=1 Tax=Xanthomonas euvesicatoria TaxID=456327 RepID=UPI00062CFCE9
TLIVDKTGTLTEGRPAFRDTLSYAGFDADQILRLAGSLEQGSEHPLAEAIVAEAQRRGLDLVAAQDFDSLTGHGVRGRVADQDVVLGNQSLMASVGADIAPLQSSAERLRKEGASVMFL